MRVVVLYNQPVLPSGHPEADSEEWVRTAVEDISEHLTAAGRSLENANPYGWRIFRPIIQPLARAATWALVGMHRVLDVGYGWVLILFGLMHVVLLRVHKHAFARPRPPASSARAANAPQSGRREPQFHIDRRRAPLHSCNWELGGT